MTKNTPASSKTTKSNSNKNTSTTNTEDKPTKTIIPPRSIEIDTASTPANKHISITTDSHTFNALVKPDDAEQIIEWSITKPDSTETGSIDTSSGIYNPPETITDGCGITITVRAASTVDEDIYAEYRFTILRAEVEENNGVFTRDDEGKTIHVICTPKALENIGNADNIEYRNGTDIIGNFELGKDLDMTSIENFDPIGNFSNYFVGRFNGNGYSIQNLIINRPSFTNVGLFASIRSPVELLRIAIVGGSITGYEQVGGLVGAMISGTVIGYNTATISGNQINKKIGGLVGWMRNGTVIGYNTATISGVEEVGGLVGSMASGTVTGYNTATIIGSRAVDGLVGLNSSGRIIGYTALSGTNDINISTVTTDTHETIFSRFTFGDNFKQWKWIGDGKWPILSGFLEAEQIALQDTDTQ